MAAYSYTALDTGGRTREGTVAAPSERDARKQLADRRLVPVRLAPAAPAAAERATPAGGLGSLQRGLSTRSLALITRQLATLVAVAPVEEALRTVALQSERAGVRRVMTTVHTAVLEGHRLSTAMGRSPASFPPLYRAMIAAGETSGALPSILERLADLLERQQQVRGKVIAALVYPALLSLTAVGVVVALMTFVIPKVVEQFDSLGQELPLLTRIVIGISDFMRAWGLVLLVLLLVGLLGLARALRNPAFRLRFDRFMLSLPVIGRLTRDLHAARLARTLSTMLTSGLPILEGLLITARTVKNGVLRGATQTMATAIREGSSLSAAMRRAAVFPPILVYMTASGEASGRLDAMLARAAEYLEREFDTFTAAALSLLEPLIIIVMGGLVALIVLSILLPILQLNTLALG